MRLFKKIALILLSLGLLTSIFLALVAKKINPDVIKERVTKEIMAVTHKKSHIDGLISWQLFPRPSLKLSKVIIGDDHLKEEYSLSADNLYLNLKISPL